ncbi:MAG: hypothetical protein Q8O74_07315 [bacterium]|nr:hypothetical protein [bacterium]
MDTDDLTKMAYTTIVLASEVSDFLKCDIGGRAKDYNDEDSFLKGIRALLSTVARRPREYLDSWDLLDGYDDPLPKGFTKGVKAIIGHIDKTLATPQVRR